MLSKNNPKLLEPCNNNRLYYLSWLEESTMTHNINMQACQHHLCVVSTVWQPDGLPAPMADDEGVQARQEVKYVLLALGFRLLALWVNLAVVLD